MRKAGMNGRWKEHGGEDGSVECEKVKRYPEDDSLLPRKRARSSIGDFHCGCLSGFPLTLEPAVWKVVEDAKKQR